MKPSPIWDKIKTSYTLHAPAYIHVVSPFTVLKYCLILY